jgi:hypothetical protein
MNTILMANDGIGVGIGVGAGVVDDYESGRIPSIGLVESLLWLWNK